MLIIFDTKKYFTIGTTVFTFLLLYIYLFKKYYSTIKRSIYFNILNYKNKKKINLKTGLNYFYDLDYYYYLTSINANYKFIDLKKKSYKYLNDVFYIFKNLHFLKKKSKKYVLLFLKKNKAIVNKLKFFYYKYFILFAVLTSHLSLHYSDLFFFIKKKLIFYNRIDISSFFIFNFFYLEFFYFNLFFIYLYKIKNSIKNVFYNSKMISKKIKKNSYKIKKSYYLFNIINNVFYNKNNFTLIFYFDILSLSLILLNFKAMFCWFFYQFKFLNFFYYNFYFWKNS